MSKQAATMSKRERSAVWFREWVDSRAWVDGAIFWALVVGYMAWLLSTVSDLGYARDEGFYFQAADYYLRWFKEFAEQPLAAMEQSRVDRYWKVNHEHPALIKSLFALSHYFLHEQWGWIEAPGTSYRFVGMALSSLAIGTVYAWGARLIGRGAGIVAALSFALLPRVFYHSHLDCFDMPVLAMWLFTTYAYWRSLERNAFGWVLASGVLYGLLLNTKHNSWLLPFALVAHLVLTRSGFILDGLRQKKLRIPWALVLMATLGPLLFYALWPWIWFDTFDRLTEYVRFHTAHVYYNMEFLGQTYFRPPFPRGYAWLMSLGTVPFVTWVLSGIGLWRFGVHAVREHWLPLLRRIRSRSERWWSGERPEVRHSTLVLWLVCILVSYAPWVLNTSPIFGGTKHWMTAYPFLCLFAGCGFHLVAQRANEALRIAEPRRWWVGAALGIGVLLAPFAITWHSHPWGLTTYTPIVGGAPGAATLGLNRSFWGYTTGAVADYINQAADKRARVFVHDTALQSWSMMERDGTLRKGLRPQLGVAGSSLAVYHHEQHMARVEHQIWIDYGTVRPTHIGAFDGVPVVWIYERNPKPAEP